MSIHPPSGHRATLSALTVGALLIAACGAPATTATVSTTPAPQPDMSTTPPRPDRRIGLAAGSRDTATGRITKAAAQAEWNMHLLSATPQDPRFVGMTAFNSDLAFKGSFAFQGNYNGWQVWDISNVAHPTLRTAFYCPASQSDVSTYQNLLFVSAEGLTGRKDCGNQGISDSVSTLRVRGIRIFDITDISKPKYVTDVQTCRGSHTHTVLVDPKDKDNVYIYISGSSGVRDPKELSGCEDLRPEENPTSQLFRSEVIKVPLAHPEQAKVITQPHIFQDLVAPPTSAIRTRQDSVERAMRDSIALAKGDSSSLRRSPTVRGGPTQCHDITVYPAIGRGGGACGGYGLLLDITDPANPKRIGAVADSNFSFWHSATFSNDGSKILFTDEWGGGTAPRCRSTDKYEWGADAIFALSGNQMTFKSYYKMPAVQTPEENCVAHNGSLVPIPGRDVMVQGWYQGGVSVFDYTDINHPKEIAYFDRGPLDASRLMTGGSWSAYWYNGVIVSSEIARGLDIFELLPSGFISQNELAAAKSVHFDYLNAQGQPHLTWPASFSVVRSYVDQLARGNGMAADKIAAIRADLDRAEQQSGAVRRTVLTALSTRVSGDASSATDSVRARALVSEIDRLAAASQ
jgi:hypothetical protein